MKSIGIVRRVDELGRLVLPKELRNTMEIKEGTPLEIYVDGEAIVLKKYEPDPKREISEDAIDRIKQRRADYRRAGLNSKVDDMSWVLSLLGVG